jgi:gamma-glutamyltranspeptidase
MTLEDLSQYEAKWRAPITFTYKDLKSLLCLHPAAEDSVWTK